ncbi:hypothetical protein CVIRNUC_007171 [Coccomyxa viridis]|uniref:Uncharacterized protein n=1 Tax=Coccomyxa viridis TaxID=1274662 RepID=A0AAV1I9T6_9CHLO|nr:hypothetical protein CVIRNUC_007171 [Coccomyxa viridis]
MAPRGFLALCLMLCASSVYGDVNLFGRLLKGSFQGWSCQNGIICDTNGNQASSDGNYAGGPWVWLGGNDCQASAVAIASSNGNDGSDAYAQAAAYAGGRKLLGWGGYGGYNGYNGYNNNGGAAAASSSAAAADGGGGWGNNGGGAAAATGAAAADDGGAAAATGAGAAAGG